MGVSCTFLDFTRLFLKKNKTIFIPLYLHKRTIHPLLAEIEFNNRLTILWMFPFWTYLELSISCVYKYNLYMCTIYPTVTTYPFPRLQYFIGSQAVASFFKRMNYPNLYKQTKPNFANHQNAIMGGGGVQIHFST